MIINMFNIFISCFILIASYDFIMNSKKIQKHEKLSVDYTSMYKYIYTDYIHPLTLTLFNSFIQSILMDYFAEYKLETNITIYNSIIAFILYWIIQDFYFYCYHYLTHNTFLYKNLHKIHHEYKSPNICCSYYEHPIEHIICWSAPYIIFPHIIPINYYAYWLFVILTTNFSIIGHCGNNYQGYIWYVGYIFFPITIDAYYTISHSYHHDLHHLTTKYNYSLWFTYLDRLFGTLYPDYDNYCKKLFYEGKDQL